MAVKRCYAIREGKKSGVIVDTWDECTELVTGYSGSKFKGFSNRRLAQKWLDEYTPKPKKKHKNKQQGVDTRDFDVELMRGCFIPATEAKDKYGYYKPLYYMKDGIRMADCGRTVGENYVQSDETTLPWKD